MQAHSCLAHRVTELMENGSLSGNFQYREEPAVQSPLHQPQLHAAPYLGASKAAAGKSATMGGIYAGLPSNDRPALINGLPAGYHREIPAPQDVPPFAGTGSNHMYQPGGIGASRTSNIGSSSGIGSFPTQLTGSTAFSTQDRSSAAIGSSSFPGLSSADNMGQMARGHSPYPSSQRGSSQIGASTSSPPFARGSIGSSSNGLRSVDTQGSFASTQPLAPGVQQTTIGQLPSFSSSSSMSQRLIGQRGPPHHQASGHLSQQSSFGQQPTIGQYRNHSGIGTIGTTERSLGQQVPIAPAPIGVAAPQYAGPTPATAFYPGHVQGSQPSFSQPPTRSNIGSSDSFSLLPEHSLSSSVTGSIPQPGGFRLSPATTADSLASFDRMSLSRDSTGVGLYSSRNNSQPAPARQTTPPSGSGKVRAHRQGAACIAVVFLLMLVPAQLLRDSG